MHRKRLVILGGLTVLSAAVVAGVVGWNGGEGPLATGHDGRDSSTYAGLPPMPAGTQVSENRAGGDYFSQNGAVADAAGVPSSKSVANQATGGSASAPAGGGTVASLPGLTDRKIILNATIALNVTDVSGSFDTATGFAKSNGGYVERSSFVATGGSAQKAATLTIRVPSDRYDQLLSQLRGIPGAKVASESSKSSEVTEQYTDLQSRVRNLQRTEQSYLKLLEQAKTVQEILSLNDRLDSVRGQIEQVQGRINVLDHMTDLATIDVTLAPIVPGKADPADGPKPVGEAFADAWEGSLDALRYMAAAGAVALVAAGWLVVPVIFIALGLRRMLRRPAPAPQTPVPSA